MSQNQTGPLSPSHTPSDLHLPPFNHFNSTFSTAPISSQPFHFGDSRDILASAADAGAGPSHFQFQPHNPAHIPLPQGYDNDLLHGPTIAQSVGYKPVSKTGGSRRKVINDGEISAKAKGKRKREASYVSDNSEQSDVPITKKTSTHGGRRSGAGNYGDTELKQLLTLTEAELPVGQHGWKRIHTKYSTWAAREGHSPRDAKSLEAKFKMLVKMKKPTGSGKRPESITHAKSIDILINEKVGTRNLDDSEEENEDEDDDGNVSNLGNPKKYTVTARSDKNEALSARRPRGNPAMDLAQKLAYSLDPEVQRRRDEERANFTLQNTQIFTLSQQLRDANASNEALRAELTSVRERLHQAERARDRLDSELNLERRMAGLHAQQRGYIIPSRKYDPDLVRVKGKVRCDEYFPEGGHSVTWMTDGSSVSDWEEVKENIPEPSHRPTYKPQHAKYSHQPFSQLNTPPSSSPFVDRAPATAESTL